MIGKEKATGSFFGFGYITDICIIEQAISGSGFLGETLLYSNADIN